VDAICGSDVPSYVSACFVAITFADLDGSWTGFTVPSCLGDPPADTMPCGPPSCLVTLPPDGHLVGEWGSCSVSCGKGTKSRDVTCADPSALNGPSQPPKAQLDFDVKYECPQAPPDSVTDCNAGPCPNPCRTCSVSRSLAAGAAPLISTLCAGATAPSAADVALALVRASVSADDAMIALLSMCFTPAEAALALNNVPQPPASGVLYKFMVGEWAGCSVTCGQGAQSRSHFCADTSMAPAREVGTVFCEKASVPVPEVHRDCQGLPPCTLAPIAILVPEPAAFTPSPEATYSYVTTSWGPCSATCGDNGYRLRAVTCAVEGQEVDDLLCLTHDIPQPVDQQNCSAPLPCQAPTLAPLTPLPTVTPTAAPSRPCPTYAPSSPSPTALWVMSNVTRSPAAPALTPAPTSLPSSTTPAPTTPVPLFWDAEVPSATPVPFSSGRRQLARSPDPAMCIP
jgi:hypothetical protein